MIAGTAGAPAAAGRAATLLQPGDVLCTAAGRAVVVTQWVGEGSYARLYRASVPARGSDAGRDCVVKLAKTEVDGSLAGLERERMVLSGPPSRGVPGLLDAGASPAPFLVFDLVDGEPLRSLLEREKQLPLLTSLAIFADLAAALADLHGGGVAHADLRPDNVLIETTVEGGRARRAILFDLGSAVLCGEPRFEKARGEDLAALGALLHRMLTGRPPESGADLLSPSSGYNREAVRLFECARSGTAGAARLEGDARSLLERLSP